MQKNYYFIKDISSSGLCFSLSIFVVVIGSFLITNFNEVFAESQQHYILINKWGSKCDAQPDGSCINKEQGKFSGPTGLAIDSLDNVYVIDSKNNRIQKFSNDGSFIAEWGSIGTKPGLFQDANSIAVDKDGFVYVADNISFVSIQV